MATANSNAFSISVVAQVPGSWSEISVVSSGAMISTVKAVAAAPGINKLIAASGSGFGTARIWSSIDNGASWQEIGLGTGTQAPLLQPLGILFDRLNSDTFWVFGNFANPPSGGLVKTTNGGNTFTGTRSDEVEGVGVDFSDPLRKLVVIGVHERAQKVWKATDGGVDTNSWMNIGANLPAGTAYSSYPLVIDANTYLIGCSFTIPYGTGSTGPTGSNATTGIYRTTNGGANWSPVSTRAVYGTPLVSNGKIYWPYFDYILNSGGILYSADNGQTWTERTTSSLLYAAGIIQLASGKFASMNTNRKVVISPDASTGTWTEIGNQCPIGNPSGLTFNSATNTFVAYDTGNGRIYRLIANASAL
jgi:photosystem II stability/assembly factor-like uncharacterized protein